MAAKILYSLTDEKPDLQTQIGCMTGIYQMFDRQHMVPGRHISGHSTQRLTSGNPLFGHCLGLFCCLLYLCGSCSSIYLVNDLITLLHVKWSE